MLLTAAPESQCSPALSWHCSSSSPNPQGWRQALHGHPGRLQWRWDESRCPLQPECPVEPQCGSQAAKGHHGDCRYSFQDKLQRERERRRKYFFHIYCIALIFRESKFSRFSQVRCHLGKYFNENFATSHHCLLLQCIRKIFFNKIAKNSNSRKFRPTK